MNKYIKYVITVFGCILMITGSFYLGTTIDDERVKLLKENNELLEFNNNETIKLKVACEEAATYYQNIINQTT